MYHFHISMLSHVLVQFLSPNQSKIDIFSIFAIWFGLLSHSTT